jgi:homocitrate synthase NifV
LENKITENIIINDTTLRDGEQAPGISFTLEEKRWIAGMLDEIGVLQIEAGTPAMGLEEQAAIKAVVHLGLKAQIIAWSRATTTDIDAALSCGVNAVAISIPASDILLKYKLGRDKEWALNQLKTTIRYARRNGFKYIYAGAEDASRADMDFLIRLARTARDEGARRLRYADTLGVLDPFLTYTIIGNLVDSVPGLDIEIHAHNDLGMATANTLAALKAGAQCASTTVGGLGERAGNAPMEEVVMALKYQEGITLKIDTKRFKNLAEEVSRAANRPIPSGKPLTGTDAFTHESGIHVDGLLKNLLTYQFISPEDVGQKRRFVIGKHSGSKSLIHILGLRGIDISPGEVKVLLILVREKATELKRVLTDEEVFGLLKQC